MIIYTVTNSSINNYGAILQAFALQKELISLGADAYVLRKIDHSKSKFEKLKLFFLPKEHYTLKDKIKIRQDRKRYSAKGKKLLEFYQNNIRSRICHSLKEASLFASSADAMIAGSDQIWSPTANMLSAFTTLQFGPEYIRRYSYAASVGASQLDSTSKEILKEGLKHFSAVSVRESSTINLISSITEKKVFWNIDPTLLFGEAFWSKYSSKRLIEKPYIIVYMLRPEPLTLNLAKKLSKQTGKELFVISNRVIEGVNNITDAGIEEWLSYIQYADFVITNSFHGTAFSVIFQKQFMSVAVEGSGMRVSDLLHAIGLEKRIATSIDDLERIQEAVKWDSIEACINQFRMESELYLKGIIDFKREKNSDIVLWRNKSECSSCGACVNICPNHTIYMKEEADGFVYPFIEKKSCIKCGLCKKVCAYKNGLPEGSKIGAYAAVSKDDELLKMSASGGIFSTIARSFLSDGGIVFGCAISASAGELHPIHMRIESVKDLHLLQSSKYAQSDIQDTYSQAQDLLRNGKKVLFSGTPCQIAGLRGFLGNTDLNSLFLIDLICHGVPSDRMLNSYLKELEIGKNIRIKGINFRDKRYGWGEKGTINYVSNSSSDTSERIMKIDPKHSSFYNLYLKGAFYRENCYSCPYTEWRKRPGDITIGDYWGIKNQHPEYLSENGGLWDINKGVSCVLINTSKGNELIESYASEIDFQPTTIDKIANRNKMLTRPTFYYNNRDIVMELYKKAGYKGIDRWFWKKYGASIKLHNLYHYIKSFPFNFALRKRIKNYSEENGLTFTDNTSYLNNIGENEEVMIVENHQNNSKKNDLV